MFFLSKTRFTGFLVFLLALSIFSGCGSSSTKETRSETKTAKIQKDQPLRNELVKSNPVKRVASKGPTIKIKKNSPADTVSVFYERLRNKKVRDAIRLTNLRPAVEGLTDDEMKSLGTDFNFLAQKIPEAMPINGEIITGDTASVTVKMPNEESGKLEITEIKLRKEGDNWVILVADKDGEKMAKKEGKNYFFALRIEVHHREARAMLDRIGKAQMIYSMKNGGKFTNLRTLIKKGFVPQDAKAASSTGYTFDVKLALNKATYTAIATPAVYGKTGKLSFALKITKEKQPQLISKDIRGKALVN